MEGCLILSINETERIAKRTEELDREEPEDLSKKITKIPSIRGTKIYYNCGGYYFNLEPITEISSCIFKLMKVFGIPMRSYFKGTIRRKEYMVFDCLPEHETFFDIKNDEITKQHQLIFLFHWILGLKLRIWVRKIGNVTECFSCGPYNVNYKTTKMKDKILYTFFPGTSMMTEFGEHFSSKLQKARNVFPGKYHSWSVEMCGRIRELR